MLKLDGDANVYAKLNLTGKVNRLRAVQGPLGGSFVLDYRPEGSVVLTGQDQLGQLRTVDMSSTQWVLASVDSFDGQTDPQPAMRSEFDYRIRMTEGSQPVDVPSGVFDRVERENLGFAHVQTRRKAASPAEELVVDQFFHNQTERPQTDRLANYALKGLPFRVEERNGEGKLFRLVTINYQPTPVLDAQGTAVPTVFFPQERRRETALFEGTLLSPDVAAAVRQVEERQFDTDGNLTTFRDVGDPTDLGDDVVHTISYDPRASLRDRHIFKPTSVNAVDAAGTLLRRREATYGPDRGELLGMVMVLQGGNDPATGRPRTGAGGTNPFWSFEWDEFGNLIRYVDPTGYVIAYEYDNEVRTHRISARDAFGYVSQTQPNLRFGAVDESIDINNQKTVFRRDEFGRTTQIFGPRQEREKRQATISVEYSLPVRPASQRPAHALVKHLDVQDPADTIDTASFVDGLSRVIQTKKDRDVLVGSVVTSRKSVSGKVIFDDIGRLKTKGQPFFDPGPITQFVVEALPRNPTNYSYDALSRPLELVEPDGSRTTTSYGIETFDARLRLAVRTTDANGKNRKLLRTAKDELVAVEEYNRLGTSTSLTTLTTRYSYNPLSELLAVRDAKGNETRASYDTLGQLVNLDNRDTGRTEYRYDLGGNLAFKQTAELRARNAAIRYQYRFNRLERIDYPFTKDVVYTYGESGAPSNRAGRIATVEDESGIESRFYGPMGETVRTARTLVDDHWSNNQPVIYTTLYEYDDFGRLLKLTYPDGEELSYDYDRGGLVTAATGVKTDSRGGFIITEYVRDIQYDEFEQRASIDYVNGVRTGYGYDPLTRRLTEVNSDRPAGTATEAFQRLRYSYDLVGNVLGLRNDLPVPPASVKTDLGGPVAHAFEYDDLYQLVKASGKHEHKQDRARQYTFNVSYDEIGNITRKSQRDVKLELQRGNWVTREQAETTRNWSYEYRSSRPHAPTRAGDIKFSYDANGNRTREDGSNREPDRKLEWTEENRLREVEENNNTAAVFLYDADGARTKKRKGKSGPTTVYPNQYFTVRKENNRRDSTKHVFIGEGRVASRMGDGTKPTYFVYHSDQLLSTEFLTDAAGALVEREEYFPSGESWVSNGDGPLTINYRFNAKELDEETGYHYFGARYYDSRVSQWANPDPILSQYLSGQVNGGVFTPGNLGLYTYTLNNPTTARDPDGRAWWSKAIKIGRAVYKGGDVAMAFADAIQDFQTLTDSNASLGERILAGVSLASELAPVSFSDLKDARRIVNAGLDKLDDIKDTRKALTNAGDALPKVDDSLEKITDVAPKPGGATKELHRPYIRKGTRAEVDARAPRDELGRAIDPNEGIPIEGKPDLGHKPGHEFRREKAKAEAEGLTQKEFNDRMNNPDLYQLENPSSNRSHKFEQKP